MAILADIRMTRGHFIVSREKTPCEDIAFFLWELQNDGSFSFRILKTGDMGTFPGVGTFFGKISIKCFNKLSCLHLFS